MTVAEQYRIPTIQPINDQGGPAKLDTSDGEIVVETLTGDATGTIENYNAETGSFDVVVRPGASGAGASTLQLKGDADMDAGEVREITLDINVTVNALEASGFTVGVGTAEPLVP